MNTVFEQIKHKLIVSCQAESDSPFNSPQGVGHFAKAAEAGGAAAIRSCGIEKTKYIIAHINLPVIGLTKSRFKDGTVCITGSFTDVERLIDIGVSIIAVDGTSRLREGDLTGHDYIREIKSRYKAVIMADISTSEEAAACAAAGADCVSTTLAGYTPYTSEETKNGPSFSTLEKCIKLLPGYPVFAEGRFNTPEEAISAIEMGAWSVVVGSAITRPHLITEWFVKAIETMKIA